MPNGNDAYYFNQLALISIALPSPRLRLSHRLYERIMPHSDCFLLLLYISLPTVPVDPYPLVPPSHPPDIVFFMPPITCSPIRTSLLLLISGAVLNDGI